MFPLHPEIDIIAVDKSKVILGVLGKQIKVNFNGDGFLKVEKSAYYPEFGLSVENNQLHFRLTDHLPIEITTRISW